MFCWQLIRPYNTYLYFCHSLKSNHVAVKNILVQYWDFSVIFYFDSLILYFKAGVMLRLSLLTCALLQCSRISCDRLRAVGTAYGSVEVRQQMMITPDESIGKTKILGVLQKFQLLLLTDEGISMLLSSLGVFIPAGTQVSWISLWDRQHVTTRNRAPLRRGPWFTQFAVAHLNDLPRLNAILMTLGCNGAWARRFLTRFFQSFIQYYIIYQSVTKTASVPCFGGQVFGGKDEMWKCIWALFFLEHGSRGHSQNFVFPTGIECKRGVLLKESTPWESWNLEMLSLFTLHPKSQVSIFHHFGRKSGRRNWFSGLLLAEGIFCLEIDTYCPSLCI